jgi:hypothetical protein
MELGKSIIKANSLQVALSEEAKAPCVTVNLARLCSRILVGLKVMCSWELEKFLTKKNTKSR